MRLLLSLLVLAAVPAGAQFAPRFPPPGPGASAPRPVDYDPSPRRPGPAQDVADIRDRISDGRASGQLSKREARRFRREAGQIGMLADRYGQDGLSAAERRELELRAGVLRDQAGNRRLGIGRGGGDRLTTLPIVTPAQAGVHKRQRRGVWTPAYAGVTEG